MTATPTRRGELTGATGPEGWAIFDPETDQVHLVNESARAIWELCDGSTTTREMASAIAELTGISLDQAIRDVDQTVENLESLGLVY
jgi:hypothetical protein